MIKLKFCKWYDWNNLEIIKFASYKEFFDFYIENADKGCIFDVKINQEASYMKEFNNKEDFSVKLDEISQRECGCDFHELSGTLALLTCILEAKEILSKEEHKMIKRLFST